MPGKTYAIDLVVQEEKLAGSRSAAAKDSSTRGPEGVRPPHELHETGKHSSAQGNRRQQHRRAHEHAHSSDSSSDSGAEEEDCCLDGFEDGWRYPMYSPSASYRQVDVVSGSHQYTISGFPLAHSMGCGSRLCSDYFEVCGQLFRLEVYPGGFTADTRRFVSVFLTTPGALNPNHIMYELAILDQSGKDRHIVEKRSASSRRHFGSGACHMHGPMLAYSRGIVAALPKFIKAKFLREHCQRYMPCGMLVLRATVQVLRGWSSAPMVHNHLAYGAGAGQVPQMMMAPQTAAPLMSAAAQYVLPGTGVAPLSQYPNQYQLLQAAPMQQWPGLMQPGMQAVPMAPLAGPLMGMQQPVQNAYLTAQPPSFSQHQANVHMSQHHQASPGVKASVLREAEPRYLVYMASPTT